MKAGDRVVDLIPGGGYFTFVFSGIVGPTGHVYATVPAPAKDYMAKKTAVIDGWAATHPNTTVVYSAGGFTPPDGPPRYFCLPLADDIRAGALRPKWRLTTSIRTPWGNLQADGRPPDRIP